MTYNGNSPLHAATRMASGGQRAIKRRLLSKRRVSIPRVLVAVLIFAAQAPEVPQQGTCSADNQENNNTCQASQNYEEPSSDLGKRPPAEADGHHSPIRNDKDQGCKYNYADKK